MTHLTKVVQLEFAFGDGKTKRAWEVECAACGWKSQMYASRKLAAGAALAHRTAAATRES